MKALFVHDHVLYKQDNDYFSPGGLPASTWKRYLDNIDSLTVISRGSTDSTKTGLIKSSIENVSFDLFFNVKGGFDYYKYKNQINQKLIDYIKNVDFVIIRVPSTIGYFAYKLCRKLNKPYVVEVVGCAWDSTWNYGSLIIKTQAPIRCYQMKRIVKNSNAATYVTQFFLQKRYPSKADLKIYASNVQIPEADIKVKDNHIDYLKRFDKNKIFRLGIVANLSIKYKGFDVVMLALKKLKNSHPQIHFQFLLVGGGNQTYVKELISINGLEKECLIVGRLQAGDEVLEFLDSLDLYVHPSKQEGLPRAVIEAMSRACPVLASSAAGIPELLNKKYLHKPGDSNKLYNDLKEVLNNEDIRINMAEENFIKAKEYTKGILEKRRSDFFKDVVVDITKN